MKNKVYSYFFALGKIYFLSKHKLQNNLNQLFIALNLSQLEGNNGCMQVLVVQKRRRTQMADLLHKVHIVLMYGHIGNENTFQLDTACKRGDIPQGLCLQFLIRAYPMIYHNSFVQKPDKKYVNILRFAEGQ